jgi:hypothetical protein
MNEGSVLKTTSLAAVLVTLAVGWGLAPGVAEATTMYRLSLSELTYVSDLIAIAEVEESLPEKAPGAIYIKTVSTLRLTRVIKGELIEGDRIDVREWGGSLGGEQTHLPGAPRYVVGERVMVFLERERIGSMWRTVGLSQGKMTLVEEPDTGRDITLRVQVPNSVERFDESQVVLPAVRRYSDDVVARVRDDLTLSFVPPYQAIPGLPPEKDRLFFEAALAAGQQLDHRWPRFQSMEGGR